MQLLVPSVVHRYFTGEPVAPTERGTQYRGRALVTVESSPEGGLRTVMLDAGCNPPDGVVVRYWLGQEVEPDRLELRIFDASGEELRRFRGRKPAKLGETPPAVPTELDDLSPAVLEVSAGFHRHVWNLRTIGVSLQNEVLRTVVRADDSGPDGPRVPPGRYRIELRCGEQVASAELELVPDPNLDLSDADYEQQYRLLLKVRDNQRVVNGAIRRCRQLRDRMAAWEERPDGSDALRAQVTGLRQELSRMESVLTQPGWRGEMDEMELAAGLDGRLFTLQQTLDRSDAIPTRQAQEMADTLFNQSASAVLELDQLIRDQLADLNASIGREALAPVTEA
jgi:hypothetical protein